MYKRSWLEIDLNIIVENYRLYKEAVGFEIMAVVKADAYGHGDTKVAMALQNAGCRNFAVSNLAEATGLRDAGVSGQILILGFTPVSRAEDLISYDITQALLSEEYAKELAEKNVKAQFALDTGMNRIGLDADNPSECERIIREYRDKFNLTGIFTHLCVSDTESENEFTKGQIAKFREVAERVSDLNLPYVHCMNSAGALWQEAYGTLARLGIILYGLKPDISNVLPEGIRPAMTWKSSVAMIKQVHPGETIGYGRTYKAEKEMTVATVPTGYADGYRRSLSNKGIVFVHGIKAPIVGRVCMDQMMIDISGISGVKPEDEVILMGEDYNADDMACDAGTIGYEIVCNITKRVPRIYV